MKERLLISLLLIGAIALISSSAIAEVKSGSHEVELHLGGIVGDDLTDTDISGQTPELGDDFAIGVGYTYNLTPFWGIEGRYTFSPNTAENTPKGDIDLDLHLIDLNALYYLNPENPAAFYLTGGVGWAFANLDEDIIGTVNGSSVQIEESDGFTFNAGVGVKYLVNENVFLRGDARYRYITELVDQQEDELNTGEFTVGIGYTWR